MNLTDYQTPKETHAALNELGFAEEFRYDDQCLYRVGTDDRYGPGQLTIREYHRFGTTHSTKGADQPEITLVFAIVTNDGCRGRLTLRYQHQPSEEILTFIDAVPVRLGKEKNR